MAKWSVRPISNEGMTNNSTFYDWTANCAATKDDEVLCRGDNARGPVCGLLNLGVHPTLNSTLEPSVRKQSGLASNNRGIN